jgi:hypothetical protein
MNKLMAILFLLGALGAFALSERSSYQVQNQSRGWPVGEPRTVYVSTGHQAFLRVLGAGLMAGCLYFVARIRKEDTR